MQCQYPGGRLGAIYTVKGGVGWPKTSSTMNLLSLLYGVYDSQASSRTGEKSSSRKFSLDHGGSEAKRTTGVAGIKMAKADSEGLQSS